MRKTMTGLLFAAALLAPSLAQALPPQAEADMLMLEIKADMDAGRWAPAAQKFEQASRLKARFPDTFDYHWGIALGKTGDWSGSLQHLDAYLTHGGSGAKFYREALEAYSLARGKDAAARKVASAIAANMVPIKPGFLTRWDGASGYPAWIRRGFMLSKYEVTQEQWQALIGNNPSDDEQKKCGGNCPVTKVSWDDAQLFIKRLNALTGSRFRLPGEAEWEYACLAGGYENVYCGSGEVGNLAWSKDNSGGVLHPVGGKQANAWGLHDMSGNVWEWVQDCHAPYPSEPATEAAPEVAQCERVFRGGAYLNSVVFGSTRNKWGPSHSGGGLGFRLAREMSAAEQAAVADEVAATIRKAVAGIAEDMVSIAPGRFTMGSPDGEAGRQANEGPEHEVRIGYRFRVGKYPLRYAQWDACVLDGACNGYVPIGGRGNTPVYRISWEDAQAFLKWLNRKAGIPEKSPYRYRLLSEAEYEYATRAGTSTRFFWGDDPGLDQLCAFANGADLAYRKRNPASKIAISACDDGSSGRLAVGSFKPNAFGLYDMVGNAAVWVEDLAHDTYSGAPADGSAWLTGGDGTKRVSRGSANDTPPEGLRSAARSFAPPASRQLIVGIRLARTLPPGE